MDGRHYLHSVYEINVDQTVVLTVLATSRGSEILCYTKQQHGLSADNILPGVEDFRNSGGNKFS